jgi:hypothetical protein
MTDEEWAQTPPGQAMTKLISLMTTVSMMAVGNEVGSLATRALSWAVKQRPDAPIHAGSREAFQDGKSQSALRNGMMVIASWSVLESCVGDFAKGIMEVNPHVLEDKRILETKVPFKDLLAPEDEKRDKVYRALKDAMDRKSGVNYFEDVLGVLDMSGRVPDIVCDRLFKAQMIRNVWAHNAGTADAALIRKAPHLGFEVGQLVDVALPEVAEYVSAMMAYGMVVANRDRKAHGIAPMAMTGNAAESAIGQEYIAMYRDAPTETPTGPGWYVREPDSTENSQGGLTK